MVNSILRYQPRILSNILLLVLLISASGCGDIMNGCYGGDEYTPYTLDLHVIESDAPSLQHFSEIRMMEFITYDQESDIYRALGHGIRYSADGKALALNTQEVTFLHYGVVDTTDYTLWQDRETEGVYSGFYNMLDADIYPTSHELAYHKEINDTLKNLSTGQDYTRRLIQSSLFMHTVLDKGVKKLLSYKAAFYDSTRYKMTKVVTPRFDAQGNILFIAQTSYYKITSDSSAQNFYYNLNYQENRLLRLHPDSMLDTLFEFPVTLNNSYPNIKDMRYTNSAVAVKVDKSLYIFNSNGKELFHAGNAGKFMMSADGSAVTYDNGRYYHRFKDNKQMDLSRLVSGINFAQPYNQRVLVMEKDSALHIVDVNKDQVVHTVTDAQMPRLPIPGGKVSTTGIYYPLLTPDDNLRLIYSDEFYINNSNDSCN